MAYMHDHDHIDTHQLHNNKYLNERLHVMEENLNQMFLIIMSIFIFFMQCGFAFLEAGSVRSKNTTNILFKNLLDVLVGAFAYWAFGYAFSFGKPGNAFIGHNYFFSAFINHGEKNLTNNEIIFKLHGENAHEELENGLPYNYNAMWFFQFVFAATSATIVSGAMAERTDFACYIIYSFTTTGFIYPVVVHWVWSDQGWLKTGAGTGLTIQDFSGSGVVHITGGTIALIGSYLVGPRLGRFNKNGSTNRMSGHSVPLVLLGMFILFIGFLCFNGGSQQRITEPGDASIVALAVMNTVLSGTTGGLSSMLIHRGLSIFTKEVHYWSLLITINGSLTGMVAICAGCNDVYPWASVVIGILSGMVYLACRYSIMRFKIDDPLEAISVHLGGGLIGLFLAPIFAINGQVHDNGEPVGGIIYSWNSKAWRGLAWNLLGGISIILWTGLISGLMFWMMRMVGLLRATREVEVHGLDVMMHNEPAYPEIYNWSFTNEKLLRDAMSHIPTPKPRRARTLHRVMVEEIKNY